jgi:membrane-associated protease RseP (regulator of RpoE activity)
MRFSILQSGALAIVAGLCSWPLAHAQSDTAADPQQAAEKASTEPVEFVFDFYDSQNPSAKTDQDQASEAERADGQVRARALRDLAEASQTRHADQANEVDLKLLGEWVQRNQGRNAQGQPNAHWAWTTDPNALWFAHPQDPASGMTLAPVDDALRSHLKLPKDQGLLVTALDPRSPAAAAGVHQNDVLLKLGDSSLGKVEDLEAGLRAAGGKPVVLQLYRDGSIQKIQVQPQIQVSFGPVQAQPVAPEFWIGVSVADLEPALRAQLRLPASQGLLINDVFKESPAEKAGLKVNDILLSLNGKAVSDQKKLVELVQANGEKPVTVELLHEGKPRGDVEITPQRRKLTQVWDATKHPRAFRWDVVRPGAFLNQNQPLQFQFRDLTPLTGLTGRVKDQQPKDQNAALAKRLEELEPEMSKLLRLLKELNGTLKTAEELNQALELLKKRSAEKK